MTSAEGKLAFSDFLNVFLLNQKYDLGVLIKALQNKGLFQSLAEPNLVAESGKEASFLAGGEFPVPIAQGSGANIGVSVQFKEFGIRLNFTPTVVGDRVHLKVRPEVSTLDYGNAVLLSGFRIPSLSTRRAETELELQSGQTFAIAGLMSNQMQTTMQKIPGIGDIPILGYLFKSKASKRDQTELVVMITPEILPNNSPGVTPSLPNYPDTFMPPLSDLKKTYPAPAPAFTESSRSQAANPAPAPVADNRTEVERAQDRALATLDGQSPTPAPAAVAAAPAAASPVAAQPVAAEAPAAQVSSRSRQRIRRARSRSRPTPMSPNCRRNSVSSRRPRASRLSVMRRPPTRRGRKKRSARAAQAKQDELDREQAKKDAEAAKIQAKKDAEAAKLQAKAVKEAEATAQRQMLDARREAEREADRQRAIDAAAERLRTAEAEYQAELERRTQR